MFLLNLLILLALCENGSLTQWQLYHKKIYQSNRHQDAYKRILALMRSYYEEATSRITHLNPIRFMFEESPYYEMGYITGEIIERYRKVLEFTQKPTYFKFITLIDMLKNIESVQRLYFELYHLARMIHETPRKWRNVTEFKEIEKIAGPELLGTGRGRTEKPAVLTKKELSELFAAQKALMEMERIRAKEKKRQRKKFEKMRQAFLKGLASDYKGEKKPYNSKWPIDYGWEINTNW